MAMTLDTGGRSTGMAVARLLAYLLTLLGLTATGYEFSRQWQRIVDLRPVDLHLYANTPEAGGWQADSLRVATGRSVRLTVHGVGGVHTFALAHTGVRSTAPIAPGEQETVQFVAPAPGRYVLYCTTWCSANHWRMRTLVEVYDPQDADAPLAFVQSPPRYAIRIDPHELDMPVLGTIWPSATPDAALGMRLWQAAGTVYSPREARRALGWPNASPEEAYAWLQTQPWGDAAPDGQTAEEARWAMIAAIWQQATPRAEWEQGKAIYQQNCAACHGEAGRGDGFAAATSVGQEPNFTDLRAAAATSPARAYAKIARGGMGTGMPNWGTLLGEDELWTLVGYIQSFAYTPASNEPTSEPAGELWSVQE